MPQYTVLWFKNPVVFIREKEQFGWDTFKAGCIEGAEALIGIDAIVFLAMDAEDGGVPIIDTLVGTVGISVACTLGLVLVPVGVVVLPVGEPGFLGIGVHGLKVEGSIMSDEALEPFVMMAGKVIYREATEAGANGTQTVFVNIGEIVGSIVDGAEVIFHALAGPVAADIFVPLAAEARQTAAVGSYDDIAVGCHNLHIPSVTPEL